MALAITSVDAPDAEEGALRMPVAGEEVTEERAHEAHDHQGTLPAREALPVAAEGVLDPYDEGCYT